MSIKKLDKRFVESNAVTGASDHFPIGSIIAIHPEVISLPNSSYWTICDGAIDLGSNFTTPSRDVPDLTDNRFLMGIAGTTADRGTGCDNTLTDHRHCTNSTDLEAAGQTLGTTNRTLVGTADGQSYSGNSSSVSSCDLSHNHSSTGFGSYTAGTSGFALLGRSAGTTTVNTSWALGNHCHRVCIAHTHSPSAVTGTTNIAHDHTASTVSGSIGTTGKTDVALGTIDNRPRYFSVKFYIRIA